MRLAVAHRLDQLLDDVRRRRAVGVAHAQVDDVLAGRARRGLQPVHLGEHVGREAPDAVELGLSHVRSRRISASRRRSWARFLARFARPRESAGRPGVTTRDVAPDRPGPRRRCRRPPPPAGPPARPAASDPERRPAPGRGPSRSGWPGRRSERRRGGASLLQRAAELGVGTAGQIDARGSRTAPVPPPSPAAAALAAATSLRSVPQHRRRGRAGRPDSRRTDPGSSAPPRLRGIAAGVGTARGRRRRARRREADGLGERRRADRIGHLLLQAPHQLAQLAPVGWRWSDRCARRRGRSPGRRSGPPGRRTAPPAGRPAPAPARAAPPWRRWRRPARRRGSGHWRDRPRAGCRSRGAARPCSSASAAAARWRGRDSRPGGTGRGGLPPGFVAAVWQPASSTNSEQAQAAVEHRCAEAARPGRMSSAAAPVLPARPRRWRFPAGSTTFTAQQQPSLGDPTGTRAFDRTRPASG